MYGPAGSGTEDSGTEAMPRKHAAAPTYDVDHLRQFSVAVLASNGVPGEHADVVAERMLEADMRGIPSHGIFRLPAYVRRLRAGGYNLTPDIRILRESPVSALVDGDNALGQVVVSYAADVAAAKAAQSGMGWVGMRHSNHAGAGGVYASLALEHDLIGIYAAVGNANHMAPWGGVEPLLSTNPLAVAVPAGKQPPFVLDMATTVVSFGRLKIARQRRETLPENWVIDREGNPVTDPDDAVNGLLLPIGGYKGYGLNLAIGLIAGTLTGAAFGSETIDFNHDFKTPTNTGQFLVMISPELFRPFNEFAESVDARIAEFRSSRPVRVGNPVRTPGDQLPRRIARAREWGVELDADTVESLVTVGGECGVDFPSLVQRTR
jgi:L-2-hydroxycarboxylate dehydrogenase (NAD+)